MITSCGFYNLHIAPLSQLVLADSHTINVDGGKGAIMYLKAVLDIAAFNIGAFTARLIMTGQFFIDVSGPAQGIGAGLKSLLKGRDQFRISAHVRCMACSKSTS